jgi:DNA-binding response OmpR family regulator
MAQWKVLLVDDEVEFASALAERLRLRGIDAHMANDGEEALRRIATDCPQLVILDMMMPGMGGLEVLRRIQLQHASLPVILLTGRGGGGREGGGGRHPGVVDTLMKPVQIDDLIRKMNEVLAGQGDEKRQHRGE